MGQLKALAGLSVARNDLVANVFAKIMKDWIKEDPVQWVINTETSYRHTNAEGTTIGLFSNLPAKLGKEVSELPFFQIEAGKLPKHLQPGMFRKDFGIEDYFGAELDNVRRMLVPFLAYACLLKNNSTNFLWNVEVGDVGKQEPLIVTFKCQRSLVRLAIRGHILIEEAKMIAEAQNKVVTIVLKKDSEKLMKDATPESVVELLKNGVDKSVFHQNIGSQKRLGFVKNPRVEDGCIVVDVQFTENKDAETKWDASLVFTMGVERKKQKGKGQKKLVLEHQSVFVTLFEHRKQPKP